MSSNAVFVRDMGDITISIGTSFAIQSLYNKHPDKKAEKHLPALKWDAIFINVRTLFRNMLNATESSKIFDVKADDYVKCIKNEIYDIKDYLDQYPEVKLKVYYYLPTYKSLAKEFGSTAELREPSTELQLKKLALEKSVFGNIEKELLDMEEDKRYINICDMGPHTGTREDALILTHYPVDLLYAKGFATLGLIESHTGEIKKENRWYTKFHSDASERIPFNKATLTFFGDSGGMFKPQHHKARTAVMKVADKYKWNYQTTKDKIILNLRLGGEGVIEQVIRKMF